MSALAAPLRDAYLEAEQRLGRPLTLAERSIDIVGLDRDLAAGKRRLHEAVEREKHRAIRAHFLRGVSIRLRVTDEMIMVLRALHRTGQQHARREIRELAGVNPTMRPDSRALLERLTARLKSLLIELEQQLNKKTGEITAKQIALHREQPREKQFAAELTIGGIAQQAATRQVMALPGALNVASQLASAGVFSGIGSVYDESAGLFGTWTYTAVMDNATCEECEALDGDEFESWDDIQTVLPDGGPNPECYGEGRCRCRAVPSGLSNLGGSLGGTGVLPVNEPAVETEVGDLTATSDYPLLPKHARQPVETLTRDEAAAQLKKIDGNIRGLHWHAKQGRPANPAKLAAYERRQAALQAHIRGETAPRPAPTPTPPRVPAPAPVPAPVPVVPSNPFAGRTREELKADLTKRNNQIAGVKKQIKAIQVARPGDYVLVPRFRELNVRLHQLEAERDQIKATRPSAAGTRPGVSTPAPVSGEVESRQYFSTVATPRKGSKAYVTHEYAEAGMTMMDRTFVRYHDGVGVDRVRLAYDARSTVYGTYYHGSKISLRAGDAYTDTFWHEFGHFIDYQGLGSQLFRKRTWTSMSDVNDPELTPVFNAIKKTRAWDRLKSAGGPFTSRKHVNYLSTNRELFARAFAQYNLRKAEILYERGELTEAEGDALAYARRKINRRAQDEYGTHWADDDFEPVYEALDEFFRARGWLRG